jgi:hypothetical protein
VTGSTVWLWWQALGVESPTATEGTRRLRRVVSERIAALLRGKPLPPEQVERRRRKPRDPDTGRHRKRAAKAPAWPAWRRELLGTAPDAEVAARIGRTLGAVCQKRCSMGILTFRDRRCREAGP